MDTLYSPTDPLPRYFSLTSFPHWSSRPRFSSNVFFYQFFPLQVFGPFCFFHTTTISISKHGFDIRCMFLRSVWILSDVARSAIQYWWGQFFNQLFWISLKILLMSKATQRSLSFKKTYRHSTPANCATELWLK